MARSVSFIVVGMLLVAGCHGRATDKAHAASTSTHATHPNADTPAATNRPSALAKPGPASTTRPTWQATPPPNVGSTTPNDSSASDRARAAADMNAFGAALYGELRTKPGNLIWSPASVSIDLGMAYGGARGTTRAQMRRILHFHLDDAALHAAAGDLMAAWNAHNDAYVLDVANRVYVDSSTTLLPDYVTLLRDRYQAPLQLLDLAKAPGPSANRINAWVSSTTRGHIPEIVDAVHLSHAVLVLVDAVYFQGAWKTPFDRSATRDAPFTLAGGREVQTPMMYVQGHFGYAQLPDGTKVLRMPYAGDRFEMMVALPAHADGLPALERKIRSDTVRRWADSAWMPGAGARPGAAGATHAPFDLGALEPEVHVYLPRFRVAPSAAMDLASELATLGMPLAFTKRADFSGVSASTPIWIGGVLHRAFVDVDEHGTVAAAATATSGVGGLSNAPEPTKVFDADHPFLFFIRDEVSGAILFWGRLADPTAH